MVIKAPNPWYLIQYFQRSKKDAWISLGGFAKCLTEFDNALIENRRRGAEAFSADLGHFKNPCSRLC
ncbi:Potassium transporter [Dillenia turbinata]|uniref:Potassium transporter n=1 Tax=Dillenia turbinata TaxID=194707 RepID=A0AAN8YWC3_9MAGN